jgi:hypothetical protein
MACDESALNRIKNDPNNASTADLVAAIECLQIQVKELEGDIDRAGSSMSKFNSKIGDTDNLFKDVKSKVAGIASNMKDFVKSAGRQYQLAEKIAEAYKETSIKLGLSVGRSRDFAASMKNAMVDISKFGGDLGDAQEIYQTFAKNSGRVRILGEDEVSNIFKLSEAAGLYGDRATSLYETLDLMGVSNLDATKRMNDLIKDSQKVGLNSSKVVEVLADNMNAMQSYSFSRGVKGMTQMAQLGVKLRMDVSSMLQMADKFYEPEAAIEAAANLQMIGGDIAKAFGDPFETMYLARNKPEELAEKLQDMTENMMTFNSETGEYEFPAEVRMQLKSAGEQLGINTEKMIEMARQTSKIKDVKDRLSMSNMFNEQEMEGIASMARLEDGEFVVDMRNEDGEKITRSIDQLASGDYEMLLKPPKNEQDYMADMLYNAQTTNQRLDNLNKSFEYAFLAEGPAAGGRDVYQLMEDSTVKTIESVGKMTETALTNIVSSINDTYLAQLIGAAIDPSEIDTKMSTFIDNLTSAFSDYETTLEEGTFDVNTGLFDITSGSLNETGAQVLSETNTLQTGSPCTGADGSKGTIDSLGRCMGANGKEIKMKKGGMVPAGFPNDTYPARLSSGETVLPNPVNLKTVLSSIGIGNNTGNMDVGGTISVNISAPSGFGDYSETQKQEIKDLAFQQIKRYFVSKDGQTNTPTNGNIESITNNQLT